MMQVTLKELVALRSAGLKSVNFSVEGAILAAEFFPAESADTSPLLPRSLDLGAPEMCACSHDETQHSDGFCLIGCSPSVCSVVVHPPKSDTQEASPK